MGHSYRLRFQPGWLTAHSDSASMNIMNQLSTDISLCNYMNSEDGWGNSQGRETYQQLLKAVEGASNSPSFKISMRGVRRVDVSFAREAVIELAARYKGKKGFCLVDVEDGDQLENWEAAATRREFPIIAWVHSFPKVLGPEPSRGNKRILEHMLRKRELTASELADDLDLNLTNASTKLKQLLEQGYIFRREEMAPSGGIEYRYFIPD